MDANKLGGVMLHSVGAYLTCFDEASRPSIDLATRDDLGEKDQAPNDNGALEKRSADAFNENAEDCPAVDYEQLLQVEREAFNVRLDSERSRWRDEEGARLSERFCSEIEKFFAEVETRVGEALKPLLDKRLRERMVNELCADIRLALANKENPAIRLYGPPDLISMIRDKLEVHNVALVVVENANCDVLAHVGQTVIQTRFDELLSELPYRE
jgi:hypothetical protein